MILYLGVEVSKKEKEVILFLQTGSNNFVEAYFNYLHRKQRMTRPTWTIATWFNKVIKSLHNKNLFTEVPFIYHSTAAKWADNNGFVWMNPGVKGSKSNFQALTLHDAEQEFIAEKNKII